MKHTWAAGASYYVVDVVCDVCDLLPQVYPPMESKSVKELFTEINKVEPVTLVDLPDGDIPSSWASSVHAPRSLLAH